MTILTDAIIETAPQLGFEYHVLDYADSNLLLVVAPDGTKSFGAITSIDGHYTLIEERDVDCTIDEARRWASEALYDREALYAGLTAKADTPGSKALVIHDEKAAKMAVEIAPRDRRNLPDLPQPEKSPIVDPVLMEDIKGGFKEAMLRGLLGPTIYAGLREYRRTGHRYKKR